MSVAIGFSGDRVGALAGSGWRTTPGIPGARRRRVRTPVTQHPQDAWSVEQLREIALTAADNPSAERELLEAARRHGLEGLKDECRRGKARSLSETEARARYEQIRQNRSLHMWTDIDGVGRVEAKLTPDDLARLAGAIRTQSNAIFHEARQSGHREPTAAYDADALVALVTGTGVSSSITNASDTTGAARAH